jgi:hypothetical protein
MLCGKNLWRGSNTHLQTSNRGGWGSYFTLFWFLFGGGLVVCVVIFVGATRIRLHTHQVAHASGCTRIRLHTHQVAHALGCTRIRLHTHQVAHASGCTRIRLHTHQVAHASVTIRHKKSYT